MTSVWVLLVKSNVKLSNDGWFIYGVYSFYKALERALKEIDKDPSIYEITYQKFEVENK